MTGAVEVLWMALAGLQVFVAGILVERYGWRTTWWPSVLCAVWLAGAAVEWWTGTLTLVLLVAVGVVTVVTYAVSRESRRASRRRMGYVRRVK